MKKGPGIKLMISREAGFHITPVVMRELGIETGGRIAVSVSCDLKRVMLARPDIPDECFPKNHLKMSTSRTIANAKYGIRFYNAATLQLAGVDFEVGRRTTYRRIFDKSGKVCAIVFSRNDSDRRIAQCVSKTTKLVGLTGNIDKALAWREGLSFEDRAESMPALIFFSLRSRGLVNNYGFYTKKAFNSAKAQGGGTAKQQEGSTLRGEPGCVQSDD